MKKIKILFNLLSKKEKKIMFFIFLLAIVSSLLEVFSIAAIIPVISSVFVSTESIQDVKIFSFFKKLTNFFDDQDSLNASLYFFLAAFILKNMYLILFVYIKNKYLNSINFRVSKDLLKKYLSLPFQFLLNNNSIKLVKNVEEVNTCISYVENLILIYTEILLLLIFLIFLSQVNFEMVAYSIIFVFLFSIILKLLTSKKIKAIGSERFFASRLKASSLVEIFQIYKEIKIYKKELFFTNIFDRNNRNEINAQLKFNMFDIFPKIYFEILFVILILFFLTFLKMENMSSSSVVLIMGIFAASAYRIMPAINRLFKSFQILKYTYPALKLIHDHLNLYIDLNEDLKIIKKEEVEPLKFNNNFEVKNLFFSYNNSEIKVLKNINFSFSEGKVSGILGSSGSGKSTLLNLITGFLSPVSGQILSNNNSIFSDMASWRSNLGYVSQDSAILNTTIVENIALGIEKEKIDNKKIKKVLELTNLSKFVNDLPKGINTNCGEKGNNISGGQKQRLCIARALYFEPKILILDEATNSLDKLTEKEILEEIVKFKDKTKIVMITHDPDIIKYFDETLNLNEQY